MATYPDVACPTCRKKGPWFSGQYGPFCSQRCRLIDLGKWLSEENKISEPLRPSHFEPFENLEPSRDLDRPDDETSDSH